MYVVNGNVDIPASKTVVIVDEGDATSYHRQSDLPWRAFACPIEVTTETDSVPRLEAEVRGYEPCLRPACFGEPQD